jgi:hypothetical protein
VADGGGSRVLLTSRSEEREELEVTLCHLKILPREESIKLLQHLCPENKGQESLAKIAEELGDLPLALYIAGKYLERYKWEVTPEDYLAKLQNSTR